MHAAALLRRLVNPGGRARPEAAPHWSVRAFWIAGFAAIAFLGAWLFLSVDLAVAGLISLVIAGLAVLVSRLSRAARLWWLFRICVITILSMAGRSSVAGTVDGRIFGIDFSIEFGQPPALEAYVAAVLVTAIVWFAAERASRG